MRELRRVVSELIAAPGPEEEAASFELAASARRFSDTTKSVVDDKLSFSATLMRAGEVEAANRLVAEVHEEVIAEEAALIERVNEVKVAQAIRRERMTRMRMARLLATALLGSGLLASSAIAAAVSGVLADLAKSEAVGSRGTVARAADEGARARAGGHADRNRERRVRIAGVTVGMSPSQIRTYRALTSDGSSEAGLEFLLTILPDEVVEKVESAMATTTEAAAATEAAVEAPRVVEKTKKKAAKAEAAAKAEEEANEEPADPPTDDDEEEQSGDEGDGEDEGDEGGLPVSDPTYGS